MARNLGRFFCTDQPGRRPHRRIGDANAGGEGENDPGFGGDPNGGDPDELCRLNRGESGLYEGRDQGGRSWRLRVNKDKSVSLLKPTSAGDEDPDQILLEQPPGSAGELSKAALGRDANAGAVGEVYPPRGSVDPEIERRLYAAVRPRIEDDGLDVARVKALDRLLTAHYARR